MNHVRDSSPHSAIVSPLESFSKPPPVCPMMPPRKWFQDDWKAFCRWSVSLKRNESSWVGWMCAMWKVLCPLRINGYFDIFPFLTGWTQSSWTFLETSWTPQEWKHDVVHQDNLAIMQHFSKAVITLWGFILVDVSLPLNVYSLGGIGQHLLLFKWQKLQRRFFFSNVDFEV